MLISDSHQFIFLRMRKVASTSMKLTLLPLCLPRPPGRIAHLHRDRVESESVAAAGQVARRAHRAEGSVGDELFEVAISEADAEPEVESASGGGGSARPAMERPKESTPGPPALAPAAQRSVTAVEVDLDDDVLRIRYADWYNVGGGDGFYVRIDPTDPTARENAQNGLGRRGIF